MIMQFTYTGKPTPEQAIVQGLKQFVAPHTADMGIMKEAIAEVAKAVAEEIEAMQAERPNFKAGDIVILDSPDPNNPQAGDTVEIVQAHNKVWIGYRAKVERVFDRNVALLPIEPRPDGPRQDGSLRTGVFYWDKQHVKVVERP